MQLNAMRMVALLFATLLQTGMLVADEPAEGDAHDAKSAKKSTIHISGVVVDAAGKPVEGATVGFGYSKKFNATSDADGQFEIAYEEDLSAFPKKFPLRVQATAKDQSGVFQEMRTLDYLDGVRITLAPDRKVRVVVHTSDGLPVADADVYASAGSNQRKPVKTNSEGECEVLFPEATTDWHVAAWKSGVGFDYELARISGSVRQFKPLPDVIELELNGARALRVKVVDQDGKPLPGAIVQPWLVTAGGNTVQLNFSYIADPSTKTNAEGIVDYDWLPADFNGAMSFNVYAPDYSADDNSYSIREEDPQEELQVELTRNETISGRVTDPDGKPLANVRLYASGEGSGYNRGRGNALTDAEGNYTMSVAANQVYFVKVAEDKWAGVRQPIVVLPGKPVAGVDIQVVSPTRLHGSVTQGPDHTPVNELTLYVTSSWDIAAEDVADIKKEGDNKYYHLFDQLNPQTDSDGHYEVLLGPGSYTVFYRGSGPRQEPAKITIPEKDAPDEIEQNFHLDRALKGSITVTVVGPDGEPVPKAELQLDTKGSALSWYRPVPTNAEGVLTADRSLEKGVLYGESPDGTLSGITRITETDGKATVKLGPTTTATGIAKDTDGNVIADQQITYGIKVYDGEEGNSPFSWKFGGSATTDAEGRFELTKLIPGETYEAYIQVENYFRNVAKVKVENLEPIELGEVSVNLKPPQPYVPPTPASRLASALKPGAENSPTERVKDLLAAARQMYTRPLVLVTQPEDPSAEELYRLFYESNEDESSGQDEGDDADSLPTIQDMRWEFELLGLSLEHDNARVFAKAHGVDVSKGAPPVLLLLDDDGQVVDQWELDLARQPVSAYRPGEVPEKVTSRAEELRAFLATHKFPQRDAEEMLATAFAQAKAEEKHVYLICSASWCGPCRMLAKFLEPYHDEMDTHYVTVKLDVSRDKNARDVNSRYKGERSGGVPWHVILDANGKELISSNRPVEEGEEEEAGAGPNMGHPSSAAGAKHFLNMLRSTSEDFDPDVLEQMQTELTK